MADDRRIAFAAIIVSGLVGVSAPIIAWVATRDTQHQASAQQLAISDRAEFRAVLDRAARDVVAAAGTVADSVARQRAAGVAVGETQATRLVGIVKTLNFDVVRLRIRLGDNDPVARTYLDAVGQINLVASLLTARTKGGRPSSLNAPRLREIDSSQLHIEEALRTFVATAHTRAGTISAG
jgi:hypothetical protein